MKEGEMEEDKVEEEVDQTDEEVEEEADISNVIHTVIIELRDAPDLMKEKEM